MLTSFNIVLCKVSTSAILIHSMRTGYGSSRSGHTSEIVSLGIDPSQLRATYLHAGVYLMEEILSATSQLAFDNQRCDNSKLCMLTAVTRRKK